MVNVVRYIYHKPIEFSHFSATERSRTRRGASSERHWSSQDWHRRWATNLPFHGWYKPSETIRMWVSTPSIVSNVGLSCGFSDVYVHHFMIVYNTHKNDGL